MQRGSEKMTPMFGKVSRSHGIRDVGMVALCAAFAAGFVLQTWPRVERAEAGTRTRELVLASVAPAAVAPAVIPASSPSDNDVQRVRAALGAKVDVDRALVDRLHEAVCATAAR